MPPIIGLPVCQRGENRQIVTQSYIDAVTEAGGIPLLLPIIPQSGSAASYTGLCDGFLFCGGEDINPLLFGQEPLYGNCSTDLRTDLFHLSLMLDVLRAKKPVLAICRGMQVMNTALGGTLYQDLSLYPSPALSHMQSSLLRSDPSHEISISSHSMLWNILGDSAYVNSFHHQCIQHPAQSLKVTARTSDGVIEAIEQNRHPFAIGVQWHPECLYTSQPSMKNLFYAFLEASACSGR